MSLPGRRGSNLGFAAAAILLLVIAALVVITARRFIEDNRWAAHTAGVVDDIDGLALLHRTAIASQRGYLLLGNRSLRDDFTRAHLQLPQQLQALKSQVFHKPAADLLKVIDPALRQRLDIAAATLDLYERTNLQTARERMLSSGGYQLDAQIQDLLRRMRLSETRLLAQRRQASETSANQLLLASTLGIPLSLLILGFLVRLQRVENASRQKSESAAQQSAIAFESMAGRVQLLSRYTGMLQSCSDTAELLTLSSRYLLQLAPALSGTIYLVRASRDRAEVATQWGQHRAPSASAPAPGDCFAMRRNQPYFCENIAMDMPCRHVQAIDDGVGLTATACVPLSAQGELMGWLYLSGEGPGPLPGIALVILAAEQLSLAMANIRLKEELLHQSIRDPLTGLFNRRYLEESLAREISRCQRRSLPLSVMMLDLDHFKSFNDLHGHPGGDVLLSAFGRLLQSSCRPEDIACRYGGEEFLLVLPEVELAATLERAQAILSNTAQMVVSHQGTPLGRVTVSIGLAMLPADGSNSTTLIEAADKALYRAKAAGRNQVMQASAV